MDQYNNLIIKVYERYAVDFHNAIGDVMKEIDNVMPKDLEPMEEAALNVTILLNFISSYTARCLVLFDFTERKKILAEFVEQILACHDTELKLFEFLTNRKTKKNA